MAFVYFNLQHPVLNDEWDCNGSYVAGKVLMITSLSAAERQNVFLVTHGCTAWREMQHNSCLHTRTIL